jgi:hypothetical protein
VNGNHEAKTDVVVTIFSAAQVTVMEAILAGLSYKEAARLGGYSARTVSRWMQHDDRFQVELLRRLEDRKLQVEALRKVIADDRTPPAPGLTPSRC